MPDPVSPAPPAPPAFYFKSLERLWEEKLPKVDAHVFPPGTGVRGGRLHAAVMFVDMSGFTALTWKHRSFPEAALYLAHHFAHLVESHSVSAPRDAIRRTYVDKLIGDAVMLVIPGPRTRAMQDVVDLAFAMSRHPLYTLKFGAHWGQVILADSGLPVGPNRSEAFRSVTVLGPTVNIASRVLHSAQDRELCTVAGPIDGQDPPLLGIGLRNVTMDDINVVPVELKGIGNGPIALQRTKFRPIIETKDWIDVDDHIKRWVDLGKEFPSLD